MCFIVWKKNLALRGKIDFPPFIVKCFIWIHVHCIVCFTNFTLGFFPLLMFTFNRTPRSICHPTFKPWSSGLSQIYSCKLYSVQFLRLLLKFSAPGVVVPPGRKKKKQDEGTNYNRLCTKTRHFILRPHQSVCMFYIFVFFPGFQAAVSFHSVTGA